MIERLRRLGELAIALALTGCTHESASEQTMAEDTSTSETKAVELGSWTTRAAEGGGSAVFAGDRTIAVGRGHAVIWQGDRRLASVEAGAASPGRARVFDERVVWGPNVLALDTHAIELRAAAVPEPMPMNLGDVAQAYAWSGDGAWLVRSTTGSKSGVEVTLHRGSTGERVRACIARAQASRRRSGSGRAGWCSGSIARASSTSRASRSRPSSSRARPSAASKPAATSGG
ncbi:hypothetical protein ACNOYE_18070 [Nannocystaceae bacterium ST9]